MKHRLPSVVNLHYFDQPAFLMSYGANFATAFYRLGDIAASILKGAKPGDIPVEQPTEFELVVNLKTAKALAIAIPQSIVSRPSPDRVKRYRLDASAKGRFRTASRTD
jgi:putative ABC transport system substrate-binding protein